MFASIDIETTGLDDRKNEIVQIGVVPYDRHLKIDGRPFYTNIKPERPECVEAKAFQTSGLSIEELCLHAPESGRVIDLLIEWKEKNGRRIPIAHNWEFERRFMVAWLDEDLLLDLFDLRARDTMRIATFINDRASLRGEVPPFDKLTLSHLCRKLGVENLNPHDALADAMAAAEVYEGLLRGEWA